uniref:Helicase domino n=2 Tax=Bactrocera dorsalis TaxID=27457 RepID=A0A034V125_BACDO
MALSHLKPGGQIKVTTSMANQAQMRQLHMQPLNMPRKINRMTQIATAAQGGQQVTTSVGQSSSGATVVQQPKGAGGVQTQLVHIQNTKSLPSSVTVQQIQHVMRQGQQGSLAATGLVLSKTSVGRVIPVSVASQSNQRQTIQVVSAASAQAALAAGNLRAHVTSGQNIAGTIKVGTAGGNQSQTQQTIHLIQQQVAAQQGQRQNASPVRLQTAGGNLVAVVQQQSIQQQQQQGMSTSSIANSSGAGQGEVMTITQTIATSSGGGGGAGGGQQQQQQQQTVQQSTAQQVRTLVKKKIMQIRSEKE